MIERMYSLRKAAALLGISRGELCARLDAAGYCVPPCRTILLRESDLATLRNQPGPKILRQQTREIDNARLDAVLKRFGQQVRRRAKRERDRKAVTK